MTSGERRALLQGWGFLTLVVAGVMTVNSMTVLHERPEIDWWEPWVWEGSSAAVVLSMMWLPWAAVRAASPEDGLHRPRFWLVHAAAVLAWSIVHVAGFLVIREAIYALLGQDYRFGPITREFPYEFRKDVLAYSLFATTFWVTGRFASNRAEPAAPATYDIRDGARVIRVPLTSILAVSSAGNYVEFLLDDGRKPLMRAPLTGIAQELADRGFVRTHRSWIVNSGRVTALRPEGSGDWCVELGTLQVPLSRRYRAALDTLLAG